MRYESSAVQTTMIQPLTVEDFKRTPEIIKNRRILIVILSIELTLIISYFIAEIVSVFEYDKLSGRSLYISGIATIFIIYDIIFMIVVIKYFRIPIRVFAWLHVIVLIIVIISRIFDVAKFSSINSNAWKLVFIIWQRIDFLLRYLTIVSAFKLAKLLKTPITYQIV